ncbi:hypothetical protein RB620_08945 [Paenibacillus sp. LHD-117]|uniref:hypothetical protein n=1 Tax=Paenibacillus sp. LHD-117 TaxID=3071412 RepID=UPI0027DFFA17|nr:hypothetical protein [Paenibacillus sp. LHD-117]MDQ6419557.1 hypothetical protein [Paenibacillus sp. LHD-117]
MSKETTEPEITASGANNQTTDNSNEKMVDLLKAVYHNCMTALKMFFDDVSGQVLNQERYGPIFVFQVKDASSSNVYACGFFLKELVARFQSGKDPAQWLSSFYFELMKTEGGKPLPNPPAGEEETKALIDKTLVPHCIEAVRGEFAPEQVHAGLGFVPENGPVFEAGFPAIRDGNNVCAVPLHILITHHLLNRDPADILIEGMYNIREQHGLD